MSLILIFLTFFPANARRFCRLCNRAAVEDGGVCCAASPHSRLRRQCRVIDDVTARAVNIAGYQMVTAIDCMGVPSKMVRLGLSQIDLIIQILLFSLRVPRFLRETPLPLADCADAAERRRTGNCETRYDVMRSM